MLRIHNVRLGHACNSSSTHSIVPIHAVAGGGSAKGWPGQWGWEAFDATDADEKTAYLAALLWGAGMHDAERITRLTGAHPDARELAEHRKDPKGWHQPFGSVDHQSDLPLPIDGPYADEFLTDFAAFLRREDVAIIGGNDNGGRSPSIGLPALKGGTPRLRPGVGPGGEKYWTAYDPTDGDRVRFSFSGQPLEGPGDEEYGVPDVEAEPFDLAYGDLPELVDLKVTGFCPFEKDCPWCYMGSTSEGSHAPWEDVERWLRAFASAGVFEVALGGGEPTLWPGLRAFLDLAEKLHVRVNLTTKNIAWLKKENLEGIGAVAVSINNARDLERLRTLAGKGTGGMLRQALSTPNASGYGYRVAEVTVQCVPAFCDDDLLAAIVDFCREQGIRVTFLGVKRTGRAKGEDRQDDLRWIEAIKGTVVKADAEAGDVQDWHVRSWLRRGVAVDTLMAAASEQAFADLGIDPVWFETTEGKFSCYVDATTSRLAVSSYADPDTFCAASPRLLGEAFRDAQRNVGLR